MVTPIDPRALVAEVVRSNFADERLNRRLGKVVAVLAKDPRKSLPKCFDSAGLEAAYRFFGNHRVTHGGILKNHFETTRTRCEEQNDYLIAHDSTSFSYRYDGERAGLARAQKTSPRSNQSFHAHLSLVVTDDEARRPLGVAAFKTWARGPVRSGTECQRWEEQMREASARLGGARHAIHLADREADDYEMFCSLQRDGIRFVVRCLTNRLLEDGSRKLHDVFANILPTIEREIPLERRTQRRTAILRKIHPARDRRVAKLSVAGARVELKRPGNKKHSPLPATLAINVVRVWEVDPPEGAEPVEWYLYTSEPIDTPEQQLAAVDRYRARWRIEELFKAIKSGCNFESKQLQDYEGLVNLLAIFVPIACRLLLIRSEAAREPEQPALTIVDADELAVLRTLGRRKLSAEPSAREVYLAIAELGGYIRYAKHDPGWQTLAAGYEQLETLTLGWRAAKLQPASDQP